MIKIFITFIFLVLGISVFSQDTPSNFNEAGLVFSNLNSFGIRYKYGNDNIMFRITSLVLNGTNTTTSYNNYSNNGINGADISASPSSSVGAGLNLGLEKIKWINNKSNFYYGFDWINSYTTSYSKSVTPNVSTLNYTDENNEYVYLTTLYNNTSNSNTWTLSSGIGFIFGLSYKLSDLFTLQAELEPSISYKYTETTTSATNYGVHWIGNSTTGYTPNDYISNSPSSTSINKGITYGLSNSGASITLAYKLVRNKQKPQ